MFQPNIAITHKILRNIISLELADQELKLRHKNLVRNHENIYILDVLNTLFTKKERFTESKYNALLNGKYKAGNLKGFKNACQSVEVYNQSLRAEDDWNLLNRLNLLINRESLSIQETNIRDHEAGKKDLPLTQHEFTDSKQVHHFAIELLRWYRKSEHEINKYIRIITLLFHLLKTDPFKKNSFETTMISLNFWLKENNILIIKTLPLTSMIISLENKDLSLNDFLTIISGKFYDETKKLLFSMEKLEIEAASPKKILNLSERQVEILKVMQTRDKITRAEITDILEVSFMTAYRDIKVLIKKRLLTECGVGRGTFYMLSTKKNY